MILPIVACLAAPYLVPAGVEIPPWMGPDPEVMQWGADDPSSVYRLESHLGAACPSEKTAAHPVFRVTRSATWWGGYTPPLERESVLSVYIPSSGDAIVELTAWSEQWGDTAPPASSPVTCSRSSLDRGLAHTLAVWASQNVRPTPPRTTPGRWIIIQMDGGTARYTVIAGLPEYGSLCVSGESDEFGQEFYATPVGRITSVLRDLSLGEVSRHDAESRLRNLFVTEWNW